MKAAIHTRYGPPSVLHIADLPTPVPGPGEVLVRVVASSVTTADWRFRASAFPPFLWLLGRSMTGFLRPRNPVLGMEFAGEVAAIGAGVTRFALGDAVFGSTLGGSNAEFVTVPEDAAIAPLPAGTDFAGAAALPFGAISANVFLRDVAQVAPGDHVLVNGASGGVGVYAVQIAKAMGARVTAVASAGNAGLLRDLGADAVLDYRADDPLARGRHYDVIFDTVGSLGFRRARRVLGRGGRFVPLNFALREVLQALTAPLRRGPAIRLSISANTRAELDAVAALVEDGAVRPVIDRVYPLDEIVAAHRHVDARHRKGAVILSVQPPKTARAAA